MAVVLSGEEKCILTTMVEIDAKIPTGTDRSFYLIPRNYTDPLPTLAHSFIQWREAVNEGVLIALAEERFIRQVKPEANMPWYEVTEAGRQYIQDLQKGTPEEERIAELIKEADKILSLHMGHEANWLKIKIGRDHWYSDMVSFIGDTYGKRALSSFVSSLPSLYADDTLYSKATQSRAQLNAGKVYLESLRGRPVQSQQVQQPADVSSRENPQKVFIVHGHDEGAKHHAARFMEKLALQAIILEERADGGRTIIEKFEQESKT